MIAIFRIRFDTNSDLSTVWSDDLFNNYMHIAIPYSLANFWWESSWGFFDLNYDLFSPIVVTNPGPNRTPADRPPFLAKMINAINNSFTVEWEKYDIVYMWFAQGIDMFGGGTTPVILKNGTTKQIPVTVTDINSPFDGGCQELGHSFGLQHEIDTTGAEYKSLYSVMSAMNEVFEFERSEDKRLPDGAIVTDPNRQIFLGKFAQRIIGPSCTSVQLYQFEWFRNSAYAVTLVTENLTTLAPVRIYALDYARQRSQTFALPALIAIPSNNPLYQWFAVEFRRNGGVYDKGVGTLIGPDSGLTVYGFNTNNRVVFLGVLPISTNAINSKYYCQEGDFTLLVTGTNADIDYVDFIPYRGITIETGRFDFTPFYNTAFVYAILHTGELYWFKQLPSAETGDISGWAGPNEVGWGWNTFKTVIPAGGNRFYALTQDGVLLWYRHNGFNDGTMNWDGANDIGAFGWNILSKIIGGGNGVIYAIGMQNDLWWYKHEGFETGTDQWRGPVSLTNHWTDAVKIFSGGNGIIYTVTSDGILWWYKHIGFETGLDLWEPPKQVGHGWQNFKTIFSVGEGIIYAIQPGGRLLWYRHKGWQTGGDVNTFEGAIVAGTNGWNNYLHVFPLLPSAEEGVR